MQTQSKYKPIVWTPERNQWLIENTKGLKRLEAYEKFCAAFPEINTTIIAVSNQRSRLRCSEYEQKHGSTKIRPLYSERQKKGYLFVKVAMPSVWWSKAKFVYVATHPEEAGEILETDAFYFLDGNNRNFDWRNIALVHRREQAIFQYYGGCVKGNPEATKIHILQARLKLVQLDAAEKIGDVMMMGDSRVIKKDHNEKARAYSQWRRDNDPEYRERMKQKMRLRSKEMTPEQKERHREVCRRYMARKREERKAGVINATDKTM